VGGLAGNFARPFNNLAPAKAAFYFAFLAALTAVEAFLSLLKSTI
jgi:hypothetical protein